MVFDVNEFGIFDTFIVVFEIESQGNTTTQTMNAPQMIIENEFVNLVQQAIQINSPCRIKMSMTVTVQDDINHTAKNIEHFVEFKNNAYLTNNE